MRKLMLGLAAICCAFFVGLGATQTVMAHGNHSYIGPGTVALYPESTEGGRRVSVLKWPKGAPLNLG